MVGVALHGKRNSPMLANDANSGFEIWYAFKYLANVTLGQKEEAYMQIYCTK